MLACASTAIFQLAFNQRFRPYNQLTIPGPTKLWKRASHKDGCEGDLMKKEFWNKACCYGNLIMLTAWTVDHSISNTFPGKLCDSPLVRWNANDWKFVVNLLQAFLKLLKPRLYQIHTKKKCFDRLCKRVARPP